MNWVTVVVALTGTLASAAFAADPKEAFNLNEHGLAISDRDPAGAERLYHQALDMWRELGPEYELHMAITESNLAHSLCAMGKRREGAQAFERALVVFRRRLGVRDERTLTTMNLLGGMDLMLGDYEAGGALFNEALPIERELFPHDIQLARTLTGLASYKLETGKTEDALPFAEEGLEIALKAGGENSLDTALAYGTVAEIHRSSGRGDRALPLYRKARAIYERLLGPSHVRVASVLSQEGLILMSDGKFSLAEQQMKKSLAILETTCPGCTLEMIVAETNLGILRLKQRKYGEADRLLSHAIALQEQYASHPTNDFAYTLKALALVREKEHLFEDAARLSKRASLIESYR
jgi:tetratricopeptide (TPR) repeat protein